MRSRKRERSQLSEKLIKEEKEIKRPRVGIEVRP